MPERIPRKVLILAVGVLILTHRAAAAPRFSDALVELVQAKKAFLNDRHAEALAHFRRGLTPAVTSPGIYEFAAVAAMKAGNSAAALTYLERMVQLDAVQPDSFTAEPDFKTLAGDPRWKTIVKTARLRARDIHDPDKVEIHSEVSRFWSAYDEARHSSDPVGVFNRRYVDPASAGLQMFLVLKVESAEEIVRQALRERPRYYAAIREKSLQLGKNRQHMIGAFRTLRGLLPEATFPDVHFLVGRMKSAGTSSLEGLLLGSEQLARSDDTPTAELDAGSIQMTHKAEDLVPIIIHELLHFLQQFGGDESLLSHALAEGGPDFIAELVTGRNPNHAIRAYGDAHEHELWTEFRGVMAGRDASNWIANKTPPKGDRPRDLGYYIGYRITQAYYRRARDKKAALRAILHVTDAKAFLRASGYAP